MKCEKCERPVGAELMVCSFRDQGECPYHIEHVKKSFGVSGCIFFAGITSAALSAWMLSIQDVPLAVTIVIWSALVIGVLMIIAGLLEGNRREIKIYSEEMEQSWRQVTLFGKPISEATTLGFKMIPWAADHRKMIRFPASVVELARSGDVTPIIQTTLLHLLHTGVIKIGVVSTKGTLGSSKENFFLMPGANIEISEIPGELEQRMIEVAALGAASGDTIEYKNKVFSHTGNQNISLKEFLLIVFEGEKQFPRSWLMTEVVGKQAIELKFGEFRKLGREFVFKFFENTRNRLDIDIKTIDQMYADLWINQPLLGPELLSQVDFLMITTIKDKSFFL